MQGLPSGVMARLDRRLGPVQALVGLLLPAFGRHALMEISLRIHEPDADQRDPEVAGLLAVIPGEHTEAAGVNRQRLVQRELGGKVGDRARRVRIAAMPPRVARAARARRARRSRCRRPRGNCSSGRRGVQHRPAEICVQHQHRVVRGLAPQRVIEAAEHVPGLRRSTSTTGRWRVRAGGWRRSGIVGAVTLSKVPFHGCRSPREIEDKTGICTISAGCREASAPGERGEPWRGRCCLPTPPPRPSGDRGAANVGDERRRDGAGRRPFGDHVDAIGDDPHRARRIVQRTTSESCTHALSSGHIVGSTELARRRRRRTRPPTVRTGSAHRPAATRESGAAVSGSAA